MTDPSYKQRVERMVFAAHNAHSKSRAKNQIKSPIRKKAK